MAQGSTKSGNTLAARALLLITIVILPSAALDPTQLPKFAVLVVAAGAMAFSIKWKALWKSKDTINVILAIYLLCLVFTVINGERSFALQLYGNFSRNTGLLFHLSLMILFLYLVSQVQKSTIEIILKYLYFVWSFEIFYSLLQIGKLDPLDWGIDEARIEGTLGNPNFLSAFLGMASVAALAEVFNVHKSRRLRLFLTIGISISLLIVIASDSIQGLGVFLVGAVVITYLRFIRFTPISLQYLYAIAVCIAATTAVLGFTQRGPLATLLYQESITFRGDYWRAGLAMVADRPLNGFGLDTYQDWYRSYRSAEAFERRGADFYADSAHNLFIDLAASGGLPLLLSYWAILVVVFLRAVKYLSSQKEYSPAFTAIFVAWLGSIAQSLISVQQVALAAWFWALTASLVVLSENDSKSRGSHSNSISIRNFFGPLVGTLIGIGLIIVPVAKELSFTRAIKAGEPRLMMAAAEFGNTSTHYLNYAANLFAKSNLENYWLEAAQKSLKLNPRDYAALKLIYLNPLTSDEDKFQTRLKLREIDPLDDMWKVQR